MDPYLFEGVVHPERAQITLRLPALGFRHITSGTEAMAHVSIILNQVALWVESAIEWDIFDLRNVAKSIVDHVFGIDVPCIAARKKEINLAEEVERIRTKTAGDAGVYLHRCFADLITAMKTPDDTGFYCYRAIEALRQYCIVRYNIDPEKKSEQWSKAREVAGCEEQILREIKAAADPVRHGRSLALPLLIERRYL